MTLGEAYAKYPNKWVIFENVKSGPMHVTDGVIVSTIIFKEGDLFKVFDDEEEYNKSILNFITRENYVTNTSKVHIEDHLYMNFYKNHINPGIDILSNALKCSYLTAKDIYLMSTMYKLLLAHNWTVTYNSPFSNLKLVTNELIETNSPYKDLVSEFNMKVVSYNWIEKIRDRPFKDLYTIKEDTT